MLIRQSWAPTVVSVAVIIFSKQQGRGLGTTEPVLPPAGPGIESGVMSWFWIPDGMWAWTGKREEEPKEASHLRELFG